MQLFTINYYVMEKDAIFSKDEILELFKALAEYRPKNVSKIVAQKMNVSENAVSRISRGEYFESEILLELIDQCEQEKQRRLEISEKLRKWRETTPSEPKKKKPKNKKADAKS